MKFLIERASNPSGSNKPCEGAVLIDKEYGLWEIEVGSMKELLSMVELGCNGIVIGKTTYPNYKYMITIYDDYLE